MLEHRISPGLAARNVVKAVSQAGMVLAISGCERSISWAAVSSVVAGGAANGDGAMFVLALEVDDGDTSRLFTVAETKRIWTKLTAILPVGAPAVTPFEHWGAALADKPGVVMLYERPAPAVTS